MTELSSIECYRTKTKEITTANQKKREKSEGANANLEFKAYKLSKAPENVRNQVAAAFSFAYDWLRDGWQYFGPITKRSKAKLTQSRITIGTQS